MYHLVNSMKKFNLLAIITVLLALIGFLFLKQTILPPSNLTSQSQNNSSLQDSSFKIEINSLIGGGFAGATNVIIINSLGEIYQVSSPDYNTPPTKTLVKNIEASTVKSIRDSLVKANIFGMAETQPAYSETEWKIVLNNQEKIVHFGHTPKNLLETEAILNSILSALR